MRFCSATRSTWKVCRKSNYACTVSLPTHAANPASESHLELEPIDALV